MFDYLWWGAAEERGLLMESIPIQSDSGPVPAFTSRVKILEQHESRLRSLRAGRPHKASLKYVNVTDSPSTPGTRIVDWDYAE